jgi:hypothetical protein
MTEDGSALIRQEYRVARRLARLFRIERSGRLERWPSAVVWRLMDRRSRLIDELVRLEERRRSTAPPARAALDHPMGALAREVSRAEQHCLERVAVLGAELDRRRGRGTATGLRDAVEGQLLGRG